MPNLVELLAVAGFRHAFGCDPGGMDPETIAASVRRFRALGFIAKFEPELCAPTRADEVVEILRECGVYAHTGQLLGKPEHVVVDADPVPALVRAVLAQP